MKNIKGYMKYGNLRKQVICIRKKRNSGTGCAILGLRIVMSPRQLCQKGALWGLGQGVSQRFM